jgi:hypothetical protein
MKIILSFVSWRNKSRDSSVGIATRLRAGRSEFYGSITGGGWKFLSSPPALGPTQPPIQWVPRGLSVGVKRPMREADHLPPSSAEVREWVELYLHSPIRLSWIDSSRSRGSWVSVVTRLRAERLGFDSRQGWERNLFSSSPRPDLLWGPPSLLSNGYRRLFPH